MKVNPQEGGTSELQIRVVGGGANSAPNMNIASRTVFSNFPSNIYTMKVHVGWEHSSFKNLDLVAIQSFDPQAEIFNFLIFGKK
jgi:hypothetical protein